MPIVRVGEKRGVSADLCYDLHGEGDTKVLFIMGFLTSRHAWEPQVNFFTSLSSEFQVCVFDNRGCGDSTITYRGYSSSQMAQDALELCEHLKWSKFHLVAISMGGMIGVELALHALDKVQSISLAVTHCGGYTSLAPLVGIRKMVQSIINGYDIQKRGRIVQSMLYSQEFLGKSYGEDAQRTMLDKVTEDWIKHVSKPSATGFLGHLKTVLTHSVSFSRLDQLKNAGIPILILTGTIDDLVPPINSHTLHKCLEVSEIIVFEGAGHCINLECEEQFNEAILANIKKANPKK